MGKGKRNKEVRKKITVGRGTFKAYLCNVINNADADTYEGLSEIFLLATGVIDKDGNLTEAFEKSPYWKVNNGVLEPSEHSKLVAEIYNKVNNG